MILYTYTLELRQPDHVCTMIIVAKDRKQARDKAWHRVTEGMPFLSYTRRNLYVVAHKPYDTGTTTQGEAQ